MNTVIALISKVENLGQVYWIETDKEIPIKMIQELNNDPDSFVLVNPTREWGEVPGDIFTFINFLPGVTDNPANVFKELIYLFDNSIQINNIHSGMFFTDTASNDFNELIQRKYTISKKDLIDNKLAPPKNVQINKRGVKQINLSTFSDSELQDLSKESKWALSLEEMQTIKNYYSKDDHIRQRSTFDLPAEPTDLEMEIFAQTWSEHCKHKIFNADITYTDEKETFTVNSLYKTYIKGATKEINAPWAVSVFNDNAGVVDWDEYNYLAIKVETHNSPSALDPYGGALTGILGVNRDILGTGLGFNPIANTNVFCVGEWDESAPLPKRIKHPKDILRGVHRGVCDGGNKSGIPTVNGAICFDENFTGKPLVYCGTIGIAPKFSKNKDNKNKYHQAGDLIVVAGGRVGLDGIHGATMSSIQLDETVPNTMVQIGDPFTQKKLSEFILALRNEGLITGLTDNGAGGISSSVGEMAQKCNGALVYLDRVPLKYSGLSPWEIFVSESQERMSFAIEESNQQSVIELAHKFGVETSFIGVFTNTGFLEIKSESKTIGLVNIDFLHNGLPNLKLNAHWMGKTENKSWKVKNISKIDSNNLEFITKTIIQDKNIVSKKSFIQNYDHEVKAATIVKPLGGISQSSPNDGGAIWLKPHGGNPDTAIAISSGIQYMFSHIDTDLMTKLSFDEAMRGVVSLGANPLKVAMTDNFCWPDPIISSSNPDGEHKLAQLVRSCRALYEIATSYNVPLISGKDSMKNDYIDESVKISVPPTLLMTAIGKVESLENLKKSAISENKLVYKLGLDFGSKYFGHFLAKYFEFESSEQLNWKLSESVELYERIHSHLKMFQSIHDVSEGGVLIAIIESMFLNKVGLNIDKSFSIEELFSEYPSTFIISIDESDRLDFEKVFSKNFVFLGKSNNSQVLNINSFSLKIPELFNLWSYQWK
jgi:phosphoribosylformylglycinamidine synthase